MRLAPSIAKYLILVKNNSEFGESKDFTFYLSASWLIWAILDLVLVTWDKMCVYKRDWIDQEALKNQKEGHLPWKILFSIRMNIFLIDTIIKYISALKKKMKTDNVIIVFLVEKNHWVFLDANLTSAIFQELVMEFSLNTPFTVIAILLGSPFSLDQLTIYYTLNINHFSFFSHRFHFAFLELHHTS